MTALTPAQVRDHARALILDHARTAGPMLIGERLDALAYDGSITDEEFDAIILAIDDAIRTARITVDWDDAHAYLSTGCLHGEHGYCQAETGICGEKTPAQCKFCAAPCVCPCHSEESR